MSTSSPALTELTEVHSALRLPDGKIWITDEFNHRILIIEPDSHRVTQLGAGLEDFAGFHYPMGMARHDGKIFVVDSWRHCIHTFDEQGNLQRSFGSFGSEPGWP